MYTFPTLPVKQKHSPAGHTYNVCSRSCYKINKVYPWTSCDCMMKMKNKVSIRITPNTTPNTMSSIKL